MCILDIRAWQAAATRNALLPYPAIHQTSSILSLFIITISFIICLCAWSTSSPLGFVRFFFPHSSPISARGNSHLVRIKKSKGGDRSNHPASPAGTSISSCLLRCPFLFCCCSSPGSSNPKLVVTRQRSHKIAVLSLPLPPASSFSSTVVLPLIQGCFLEHRTDR